MLQTNTTEQCGLKTPYVLAEIIECEDDGNFYFCSVFGAPLYKKLTIPE